MFGYRNAGGGFDSFGDRAKHAFYSPLRRDLAYLEQGGLFNSMKSLTDSTGMSVAQVGGIDGASLMFGSKVIGGKGGWAVHQKAGAELQHYAKFGEALEGAKLGETGAAGLWNQVRGVSGGFRGAVPIIMNGGFAISSYMDRRREGHGRIGSATGAVYDTAKFAIGQKIFAHVVTNPYLAIPALAGVGAYAILQNKEAGHRYRQTARQQEFGGQSNFSFRTRQAYTMRQRAIQSMRATSMNAMKYLGNEASMMHMPKSRYGDPETMPLMT